MRRAKPEDLSGTHESGFVPIDVLMASLDVHGEVGARYALRRPSFPTTPESEASAIAKVPTGDPGLALPREPAAPSNHGVFGNGDTSRLRQVAFPEFSTITLTNGDLSAVLPTFRLLLDNVSADNLRIVTLDVYDASARRILATRALTRRNFAAPFAYQDFDLGFMAPGQGNQLEWRVYYHGRSYVRHDKTTVR